MAGRTRWRILRNMLAKQTRGLGRTSLRRRYAPVFAALGDETRLTLLTRICERAPCSIADLTEGSPITRQAVTRHLRVLESAGLVRAEAIGRACVFELAPEPLEEARDFLARVSRQWDGALERLKSFVESEQPE